MKSAFRHLAPQFLLVAGLWTLIALCTGLADLAWLQLAGRPTPVIEVLKRPLIEHWIWATLTPVVFALAHRVPLTGPNRWRAFGLHMLFFVALSMVHCVVAQAIGSPLALVPKQFAGSPLVLRFLEEFYSDLWMYWPLVGVKALIDAHTAERERALQASRLGQLMADLQLSVLRAQIQPHFLFNTLHAVSALMRVDPRAAEDMVSDLAEVLRASFEDPAAHETTLRRELAVVDCYLRIQQRRLGERLTLVQSIDPDALDAAVPTLVLQSLVENAVVHGIAPVNRPGRLEITARREAAELLLAVQDDGSGLPEAPRPGVGLANAKKRLRQLYGDAHSFELDGRAGAGTRVTLRMPFRAVT
ncbi:sensor histidine kinase [Ideonella sp. YS5]|uniref:sensor histidine kinase n=1 Tax=Ideonella sp. YS5 TaxID=3453714 RepID=UPI003EEA7C31